ncbi:MAG: DUF1028 domain-containing protein [Proteobacteria bacterium]|nr:DUF1028 domain-containing protein [Pseudomonadota bacterium]
MALSILGRCARTGNVGLVVASAEVAAGSRAVAREAGTGVVVDLSGPAAGRTLAVIDAAGGIAVTGPAEGCGGAAETADGCAVTNEPARAGGLAAALAVLAEAPDLPLAERLVRALTHAEDAAGEDSTLRSAHLLVLAPGGAAEVDLRVDWHRHPAGALRALWNRYATTALACVRHDAMRQAAD